MDRCKPSRALYPAHGLEDCGGGSSVPARWAAKRLSRATLRLARRARFVRRRRNFLRVSVTFACLKPELNRAVFGHCWRETPNNAFLVLISFYEAFHSKINEEFQELKSSFFMPMICTLVQVEEVVQAEPARAAYGYSSRGYERRGPKARPDEIRYAWVSLFCFCRELCLICVHEWLTAVRVNSFLYSSQY